MCTPSLAIDMILTSGPDHIWMVQRKVTGLMALMGGFNEVGETVEEAARRELTAQHDFFEAIKSEGRAALKGQTA